MMQDTTNPPMTDRHHDDLPVGVEYDEFLDDNSRVHVTHLKVERTTDSAIIRYEEIILRPLTDEMI